jgi:hypothetical protein
MLIIVKANNGGIYQDALNFQHVTGGKIIVVGADINIKGDQIHIEHVYPQYLKYANTYSSYLMVNHELIYDYDVKFFHQMILLCKTKAAVNFLHKLGFRNTRYIGFMTDILLPARIRLNPPKIYVHFAGSSPLKQTSVVIKAFQSLQINDAVLFITSRPLNAKFPPLNSTGRGLFMGIACNMIGKNIYFSEYLNTDDLNKIRMNADTYVCPSLAEGWGHYLVEGIKLKKLVITTDAPPMNEFKTITVKYSKQVKIRDIMHNHWIIPECIGYVIEPEDLKKTILYSHHLSLAERKKIINTAYDNLMDIEKLYLKFR